MSDKRNSDECKQEEDKHSMRLNPEILAAQNFRNTLQKPLFFMRNKTFLMVAISCVLVLITLAIYLPAGNHQFINLDDNLYVTANPHIVSGLTWQNITWAFTSVEAGNWHPITWLSHMSDVELYGMTPRGHHLTSVVIHTFSTVLLFLLLLRWTDSAWPSAFAAALFALHPMHVESVAWVSQRKDVLSAFFWFLTLLLYGEYVTKRNLSLYFLSLVVFMMGLMSKPMIVTLPIIMLLVDFWPLGRYQNLKEAGFDKQLARLIALIKEKIPFVFCSLILGLITIYAQGSAGAIAGFSTISLSLRCKNAVVSYVKYISKTAWPFDLAVYYPFPPFIPLWQVICSSLTIILLTVSVIRFGRRYPFLLVGWLWFLITLVPVIGIIQVGNQSMADRYSYIPATGLFIIIAWGGANLVKSLRRYQHAMLMLLAGTLVILSAVVTKQQLGYWQNDISLFQRTLQLTANNYMINNNLALALQSNADLDAAILHFQEALRIAPDYVAAHNNLGIAFQTKGQLDAAIQEYRRALQIDPNDSHARSNLGAAYQTAGNLDAAIREYQEALRLAPDFKNARVNLESALSQKKK
jgi:Flp pilus assembly protein TadD